MPTFANWNLLNCQRPSHLVWLENVGQKQNLKHGSLLANSSLAFCQDSATKRPEKKQGCNLPVYISFNIFNALPEVHVWISASKWPPKKNVWDTTIFLLGQPFFLTLNPFFLTLLFFLTLNLFFWPCYPFFWPYALFFDPTTLFLDPPRKNWRKRNTC